MKKEKSSENFHIVSLHAFIILPDRLQNMNIGVKQKVMKFSKSLNIPPPPTPDKPPRTGSSYTSSAPEKPGNPRSHNSRSSF